MTIFKNLPKPPSWFIEYNKKFIGKSPEEIKNILTGEMIKMAIELKKEQKKTEELTDEPINNWLVDEGWKD